MKPGFYFYYYRALRNWALTFSLTTSGLNVQVGPFWATVFWEGF